MRTLILAASAALALAALQAHADAAAGRVPPAQLPSAGGAGTSPAQTSPGTAANATPQAPAYEVIDTPLFVDPAAREARDKEARRRARGEEPRVYGIAPRTENDLTWQMPDDRIIRY